MKYLGTITSSGKQTTTQANQQFQLVKFPYEVGYFFIEAFNTPVHFSINNETNTHEVDAGSAYEITNVPINKITIIENGIQYRYIGYLVGDV